MALALPPRPAMSVPRPSPAKRGPVLAKVASDPYLSHGGPDESGINLSDGDRISDVSDRPSDTHARATLLDSSESTDALDVVMEALRDVRCERAVEAASVCLATLARAVGCRGAIAHLWDPRAQDFVVVYALAPNAGMILSARHGIEDPLFAQAFAKRSPRIVNFDTTERGPLPRHTVIPGSWSVLVAPVFEQDVKLGVLELVDPLDGSCFDDRAVAAAHFVAERLIDLLCDVDTSIGKLLVADD